MVSAVNFAVRTGAGSAQQGLVAGENQSNLISVGSGQHISLNLSPGSVVAYQQQGTDLIVQLVDGRSIVLANYFGAPAGQENKLYLSSNDAISEVRVSSGVDGVLFADYGPAEALAKWSPLDDLRFSQADLMDDVMVVSNEPAGMAMLVPGLLAGGGGLGALGTVAAVAGGAVLLGGAGGGDTGGNGTGGGDTGGGDTGGGGTGGGDTGGGGTGGGTGGGGTGGGNTGGGNTGGGGTGPVPPTVNPATPPVITTNTSNPTLVVTGTGQPGDTVKVTIGGQTETTTIGSNGTWGTTFTGTNLPKDGTHPAAVAVTSGTTGTVTNLTGPTFVIDMTPPAFAVQDGTLAVGDIHNIATYTASNGATVISGQGEAGANMTVTANGFTQTARVEANGAWSVSFTPAQLPGGDYREVPVTLTSTDINGNVSAASTGIIAIDTVRNIIGFTSAGGADNTVNLSESQNGFDVKGTSVAGAVLMVTIGGSTQQITAGADGTWTAAFGGGVVGADGMATVSVSSTDAAGNPNAQSYQFRVDTVANVGINDVAGNNILSGAENAATIPVTGTSEIGTTSVIVTWGGRDVVAAVNPATGAWSANFPANLFGAMQVTNTTMVVNSVDAYGNRGSSSHVVTVDTMAAAAIGNVQMGNNIINAAEANSGVVLTGSSDPNSRIVVSFEGQTFFATADANGNWSANVSLANIGAVDRPSVITVIATDSNGNVSVPVTHTVRIDTTAPNDPFITSDFGLDNSIGGVATQTVPGEYSYFSVGGPLGAATQLGVAGVVPAEPEINGVTIPSEFAVFTSQVPDGSYLVIRDVDTAGNESSTLYLRSTAEVTVDMGRAGLQGFDFGLIDLNSSNANIVLNARQVLELTGADKQLAITGGTDDVVTLQGATATTTTVTAHGEKYKLYTLGTSGASVLIDEDILVNPLV